MTLVKAVVAVGEAERLPVGFADLERVMWRGRVAMMRGFGGGG